MYVDMQLCFRISALTFDSKYCYFLLNLHMTKT